MAENTKDSQIQKFELELAGKNLIVETGHLAGHANGSCTVQYGDTVVLATAVMGGIREGIDFFPLSVDYEERLYAAGKIKGSRWVKREGRPTDEAIISARLIDRAIRPLFPKDLKNEVQVILTVLSFDSVNDSDIVSLIAASTALSISNIPWAGPIGGVRIGRVLSSESEKSGEWVINPSFEARDKSELDLIIAGKDNKVLMIEAEGREVSEENFYSAVEFSQKPINKLIKFIQEIAQKVGREKVPSEFYGMETSEEETPQVQKELIDLIQGWVKENAQSFLFTKKIDTKSDRKDIVFEMKEKLMEFLEDKGIGKERRGQAVNIFKELIEVEVSQAILKKEQRVDGRELKEIRPLNIEVGILPRTHGSALFSRGETQVLSIITLGSPGEEQFLESMEETGRKRYMHHYNFPPYSVGEVSPMRTTGRREIGHGMLAEKALKSLLPSKEEFPYTIRVVSEVLASNGSSSMASVCGSSLALMDSGVPIKKAIAGMAMGLASDEKGNYKIITDLQDLEDGSGGMDFKLAGTADGLTSAQLDTKTKGLTLEIIKNTLEQAKIARLEILEAMNRVISRPRAELSPYAPRIVSFKINPDKIREVIGPGGKIINEIINETGVAIDIEDDGLVMVTSTSEEGSKKAVDWIKNIVREVKVGEIFSGKVKRILDFGAFVEILPGQEGMVHISELAHRRVGKVIDVVKVGDLVKVKVIAVDSLGRINLSIKEVASPDDPIFGRGSGDDFSNNDFSSRPKRPFGGQRGRSGSRPKRF